RAGFGDRLLPGNPGNAEIQDFHFSTKKTLNNKLPPRYRFATNCRTIRLEKSKKNDYENKEIYDKQRWRYSTVKAITFSGSESVKYENVADPELRESTDVIVKVDLAGICGSDLHVYYEREKGLDHGTVMGHEFVGEIVDIGESVRNFSKGDKIISPFTTNCGECYFCRIGLTSRCERGELFGWVEGGKGLHGGQAEYVRVPMADSTLTRMPKEVEPEAGLLLGDILSTGYFAAENAEIVPEGVYAVVGCGPVGLLAIISAIELGAEHVYAIDAIPERLAIAERFGATPIDYQQTDAIAILRDATDGRGVDAVLEVVGNTAAARLAYEIVRPGGIISVVGVHTDTNFAFSPADAYDKNLTYKVGRCPARFYMEKLIPFVQERKYDFTAVISHCMALSEGEIGYEIFANKKDNCTKVVLYP
ncbi:MAG: alcohol dehydrogenase family protein, partial [bacterium]